SERSRSDFLQSSLRAKNDSGLGRQDSAIAMRQRNLAVFHLTPAALATKLADPFDQKEQPVHAGMTIGQSAAVGVDCKAAVGSDTAPANEGAAFALLAKA